MAIHQDLQLKAVKPLLFSVKESQFFDLSLKNGDKSVLSLTKLRK